MRTGLSSNNDGESSSATFFHVPDSAAQLDNGSGDTSRPSRKLEPLDMNQKATQAILRDGADKDDTADVSSPLSPGPFFFGSPPPQAPLPPAPALPEADMSSSPAAMWLSSFSTPKAQPKLLEDDEGSAVGGYTLGSVVGFGGFSTIRKAFSNSGGIVAIKIIRRADLVRTGHAPHERKKLEHEAAIWSSLSHEHILPLFSAVHTAHADYFITLYCPAGSLYDILKRDGNPALPQDDAGMMFRQVVRGLRYLHEDAMLVHRDMKLENVLVDESGVCRIGDFGLSVKIGQQSEVDEDDMWEDDVQQEAGAAGYNAVHRAFSLSLPKRPGKLVASGLNPIARHNSARRCTNGSTKPPSHVHQPGSLPYAAPELLLPQSAELAAPHPSQDIWALGVMLYALLAGHLPFKDSFEPRLQMKILNGAFDLPNDIGRGAERILLGCIERNVSKRWTIAMVDEVAWGVGWGAAGDGATPDVEEHEICFNTTPQDELDEYQPHNVVDSVINDDEDDWQNEEMNSRAAMEATMRRSSSRAQRSLSRAPIIPHSARNRSMSRHRQSRAPSPGPRSALTASTSVFINSPNLETDYDPMHSPLVSPPYYDTPSRSRSASRPRGRMLNKRRSYYPSRSPSPSIVPSTPVDFGSHLLARMHLEDHPEELELELPPRGRAMYAPGFQDEDEAVDDYDGHHHTDAEPDVGSKSSQAVPAPSLIPSRYPSPESSGSSGTSSPARSVDYFSMQRVAAVPNTMDRDATIRLSSRPGSVPPTPGSFHAMWGGQTGGVGSTAKGVVRQCNQLSPMMMTGPGTPGLLSRSRSAEEPKPIEVCAD